jgi:hypothetical protein
VPSTVGNSQRRLVLEAGARCRLDQATNLLETQHAWQPARTMQRVSCAARLPWPSVTANRKRNATAELVIVRGCIPVSDS